MNPLNLPIKAHVLHENHHIGHIPVAICPVANGDVYRTKCLTSSERDNLAIFIGDT